MRSGYAPPLVRTPSATVTGPSDRGVTEVTVTRELGGAGVPGNRGFAAAEGTVAWDAYQLVTDGPQASPWNRDGAGFPPAPGAAVQVSTGCAETGEHTALTGVIDSSSAGARGVVTTGVIDAVDQLHRVISVPAMLAAMPPREYGGDLRNVGLSSDYVADLALRRCGVFSTPYMPAAMNGVSVPGQGSVWPARGECLTAGEWTDPRIAVDFLGTEWGWGIYDCNSTFAPDGTFSIADGAEISCMVSAYTEAAATISFTAGGARFELRVGADRALTARWNDGTTTTSVCSLPAAAGWVRVSMRVSAGSMSLTTDDGRTANGAHTAPSTVTTAPVEVVTIAVARGGRVGGVIVADMPAGNYLSQDLTARLYGGTVLAPKLQATPRIESQDALDLLSEIADAACRAWWWDEDGRIHWVPGDVLLAHAPVATLTSQDALLEFGWQESLTSTYADVTVEYDPPVISASRKPTVTVWQGSGDTMGSGETAEEIIAPASSEDWVQVDRAPRQAGGEFMNNINRGEFSIVGGVLTDGETTTWAGDTLSTTLEFFNLAAGKAVHVTGSVPAGKDVQRVMPNEDSETALWQRWRNEKLPVIRAYARIEWADASVKTGDGPDTASGYVHQGGPWLQGMLGEAPGRVADFLAEWLCAERVTAKGLSIVHDPRIQVGDMVTIQDEHAFGVQVTGLVTRIEQATRAGQQSMSLDVFVTSGTAAWMNLGQHDAAQESTLADHNTTEFGESLREHDRDPGHDS